MAKKLTILRNETLTYAVHLELGDPPRKLVGGLSLDLARLKVELEQHGCSQNTIDRALAELEASGSIILVDCGEVEAVGASA